MPIMTSALIYPKVDPKSPGYSGLASIAIVVLRGECVLRVHTSAEQLRARLDEDSRALEPDFKVIRQYDDMPMPAAFVEVQRAFARKESGEPPVGLDDLEHRLELLKHPIDA